MYGTFYVPLSYHRDNRFVSDADIVIVILLVVYVVLDGDETLTDGTMESIKNVMFEELIFPALSFA